MATTPKANECVTEVENAIKLDSIDVTSMAPNVSATSVSSAKYAMVTKSFSSIKFRKTRVDENLTRILKTIIYHDKKLANRIKTKLPASTFKAR